MKKEGYSMTEQKQNKVTEKKERTPRSSRPRPPKPAREKTSGDENVVFIGQKPVKSYVIACLTHFGSGSPKIVIKARGRAIARAVDTAELLRRAFLKDAKLESISTCTEEVEREGGRKANVSAIEITLTRP